MGPSYVTIIAPLAKDTARALKEYLRANANPGLPSAPDGDLQCHPEFRFDTVATLHFCSLLVLDADDQAGIPAELIFEATFDGDRKAFLHDLLIAAPAGLHNAFLHCRDYPLAGSPAIATAFTLAERAAVHAYLVAHDVGAGAYFSGSPGRTVGQVRQEHRLRKALRDELSSRRLQSLPMPPTNLVLHASMQAFAAADPALEFAKTRFKHPWQVRWRDFVASSALVAGYALSAGIGALLLVDMSLRHDRIFSFLEQLQNPLLSGVLLLAFAWLGVRAWGAYIAQAAADPHQQSRYSDGLGIGIGLYLLRIVVISLLAALLTLALVVMLDPKADILGGALADEAAHLRAVLGFDGTASVWCTLAGLAAIGVLLVPVRWCATTLELARARAPADVKFGALLASAIVSAASRILCGAALLLVARHVVHWLEPYVALVHSVANVLISGAVGLLVVMGVAAVALAAIRLRENLDARRFQPATVLLSAPVGNADARAREERGINFAQNHLASVTCVKPGLFRLLLLRATLWAVGLLARYWFNHGKLGEIPTILSARWVLIDKGRRLIFLDNYGGGWESYLNEFIDMGAVKGLNAIWCNTFIRWRPPGSNVPLQKVAFPETKFSTSGGAQAERPFKRYVRWSQVETLAWYSAYHTLSIVGINAGTKVRNDLFQPLASHEVDKLVSHL